MARPHQLPGSVLASSYLPAAEADTFTALERWYYGCGVHAAYLAIRFDDESFFAVVDALNRPDAVSVDADGRHLCRGRRVLDLVERIRKLPARPQALLRELVARYAGIFRKLPWDIQIPWVPTSRHLKPRPIPEGNPFDAGIFRKLPELLPFEAPLRTAGFDGIALFRLQILDFFSLRDLGVHPQLAELLGKASGLPQPAAEIIRRSIGK